MTPPPPPYRRIPHLVGGRGSSDDRVLGPGEAQALLSTEVVVEEKLDGANAMVWLDDGTGAVTCSLRSGPGAADRAGQLGPLRAWVQSQATLPSSLAGGRVVYVEWLWLTHSIAYDRLPSLVVVLDVADGDGRFLDVNARNAWAMEAGLVVAPEVFRGVIGDVAAADRLIGRSAFGSELAEGVVIRSDAVVAKLVRSGFRPIDDAAWAGGRPRNRLAGEEAGAWR